jgi:acetyltransferase-like isoleucine patch superfamily enzyme
MAYKVLEDVELGKNAQIHDFVILGIPPSKSPINPPHQGKLIIGDNTVIRSHSVIYLGNKIGDNLQTGHGILIRENNLIGDNVSVGTHSVIERENIISDKVRIHTDCYIPEFVEIRKKAWLGPCVKIMNVLHPPCPKWEECGKGVVIGENAKIGGNVTIGPHVTIGKNSLIGFGSVVVKDIPDDSVAVGNPAKVVKKVSELKCDFPADKPYFDIPYEWERM